MEWITAMQQAITYMEQKFIALVRNFQNETINDETNHDIPDFWDVKLGTYVVFDCIGEHGDCISDTWARFYKEFLPQLGYATEDATDYEIYFEKGRKGLFCELWIPVRKNRENCIL